MYFLAHGALLIALLLSLSAAGFICFTAWANEYKKVIIFERLQIATTALISFASLVLLQAFLTHDFSLSYVARYSDSTLPFFYTITAFWAGQEGSLLFWMLTIALSGITFLCSASYRDLSEKNQIYFWMFFMAVQAFFLLLLTSMSNPFTALPNPPSDGQGLNPLLRNVGMILHPPLLFIGYAGFTIPACLALGAVIAGERQVWIAPSHNWILVSWAMLTAGILLGGWWAYMELGWGGYWAWDPVENASLIPWFSATALLHTMIAERKFGFLSRTNVFLACLTFLLCLFATYLVRSGVVNSLHAFGEGGVGAPLLFAIIFGAGLSLLVISGMPRASAVELPSLGSRLGMIILLVWLFLALGAIVLLGTLWPVISQLWETNPKGVTEVFYNTICLPLFTLMTMLLIIAPWFNWKEGFWKPKALIIPLATWVVIVTFGVQSGIKPIMAVAGVASAVSLLVSLILLALVQGKAVRSRSFWASHGSHFAFALIVLGVAISGPFKESREIAISPGEKFNFGGYLFTYKELREKETSEVKIKEAVVLVEKNGKSIGELLPQQRLYRNYDHPNSEVSTLFSLGKELYATIHDLQGTLVRPLKISINPMVNWVWIGSIIICFTPLLAWRRSSVRRGKDNEK